MNQQQQTVKRKVIYFYTDEALKYGNKEAIVLNRIRYWIEANKANIDKNRSEYNIDHCHNGYVWTFISIKKLQAMISVLTVKEIENCLAKLCQDGILLKDNFNRDKRDRTCWYTIDEEESKIEDDSKQKEENQGFGFPSGRKSQDIENKQDRRVESLGEGTASPSRETPLPCINNIYKHKEHIKEHTHAEVLSGPAPTEILNLFNKITEGTPIPQIRTFSDKRLNSCKRLTKKYLPTIKDWEDYFHRVIDSRFLTGEGKTNWIADIDFVLTESKLIKILEGAFDNKLKMPSYANYNADMIRALSGEL